MTVKEILQYINMFSPQEYAESYDNVGLLVGSEESEITGICCTLDITNSVIDEAIANGANLIIAHHPVIFSPLKRIPEWSPVAKLIKNDISAICIHTNFDMTEGGVNDSLLELLGFESSGVLEPVHANGLGFGAVCDLTLGFTVKGLAEHCKAALDLSCVKYSRGERAIRRVAVCCGSGVNEKVMQLAREKGCDAIISGDIKHNYWTEAQDSGITLIDAGHFGTEKQAMHRIAALISRHYNEVPVFTADSCKEPCHVLK